MTADTPHILVVEDDPAYRRLVVRMLKAAGFAVSDADGFVSALDRVENDPSIALLVMDIGMPAGEPHGIAIAQMSRHRRSRLGVVYITGRDVADVRYYADGAPVLQKPFAAEALVAAVRGVLDRARP